MKTTSKLKFNPNAKSYVPETPKPPQTTTINTQPNQPFLPVFKSVYPENGLEEMNQYSDKTLGMALPDISEETIVVKRTCLELSGAQKDKFPGSLFASLTRQNALLTRTKSYMISHNPDGSRYLLLTINDNIYLIDRSMRVFNATKLFSPSFIPIIGNNTLLDGYILKRKEVENKAPESDKTTEDKKESTEENKTENSSTTTTNQEAENTKTEENKEPNYTGVYFLIVDGLCIRDQTIRAFHLEQRMKNIESLFSPLLTTFKINPKREEVVDGQQQQQENSEQAKEEPKKEERTENVPPTFTVTKPDEKFQGKVSLALQSYYPASQLDLMFKKNFPTFGFPRGGILFTPSTEIYKLGYNEYLLCWKPMEQITVDFKVGIVKKYSKGKSKLWYQLLKSNHGELILHDWITEKGGSKLSKISDGQVIRCFWDPNGITVVPSNNDEKPKEYKGGWVMRTILNKTQPNEEWVVSKLVENIESHIGKNELVKCVTTEKDLGDDFKLTPSRFASKSSYNGNNSGNNGNNNNNNNSYTNNNNNNNSYNNNNNNKRSYWKPNNNNNNNSGNNGHFSNHSGNNNFRPNNSSSLQFSHQTTGTQQLSDN